MKSAVATLVVVVATSCFSAIAQDSSKALRECSRIEDSVKRLACFDSMAEQSAPQPNVSAPVEGTGEWQVASDVSKIDDSTRVTVVLRSAHDIPGRYGNTVRLNLVLRCQENKTDVMVHFGGHFMSDHAGGGAVTYRIDRKPAQSARFSQSTNHESLFAPEPVALIKSLFGAQKLVIRAAPYNENAITAEFNVGGVENAVKPLREACKW
jgi:type VI secretion system protein VasI